eukprot:5437946-Amphidinium_carterae.1
MQRASLAHFDRCMQHVSRLAQQVNMALDAVCCYSNCGFCCALSCLETNLAADMTMGVCPRSWSRVACRGVAQACVTPKDTDVASSHKKEPASNINLPNVGVDAITFPEPGASIGAPCLCCRCQAGESLAV